MNKNIKNSTLLELNGSHFCYLENIRLVNKILYEYLTEDKKKKEEADLKNEAEQLVFQTEKSLKDLEDKIDKKEKEEAEDLCKEVKDALEANDIDKIKEKKDKLQEKRKRQEERKQQEKRRKRE